MKRKKNYFFFDRIRFFLLIMVLIAISIRCSNNESKYTTHVKKINGEEIRELNSVFAREIICIDDNILILDSKPIEENSIIVLYDLKTKKMKRYGNFGSGPGEFKQPLSLSETIGGSHRGFTINDLSLLRLTEFNFGSNYDFSIKSIIPLKAGMPIETVLVNDSMIYSLPFSITKGRIAIYDTTGQVKSLVGAEPPQGEKKIPLPVRLQAYIGKLRITPDGKHIVVSTQYADIIEIYNHEGELIKKISGPLKTVPKYNNEIVADSPTMVIDEANAIFGYIDLAVNNNYIFALFSGKPFTEHKFEGHFIHVYNMKGDFVRSYELDYDISQFAIDSKAENIYGSKIYDENKVLKFKFN